MNQTKPKKGGFSFEFFPAKTEQGRQKLRETRDALNTLGPQFFSVTFGAGGSTHTGTLETVLEMHRAGIESAPHISCIGTHKSIIGDLLKEYQSAGIKRLVALRGDRPSGSMGYGDFRYANELVAYIRETTGDHFHIEVAAYPEFHPEAKTAQQDLECFKQKVEAGANSAITQYFYAPDAYYRFVDECESIGVKVPIVPGIMPIGRYEQLARFSDNCGAEIPRWLRKRLEAYGDDQASITDYGIEVVTRLCETLLEQGAPGLHFYTLNKVEPTRTIWNNLSLS